MFSKYLTISLGALLLAAVSGFELAAANGIPQVSLADWLVQLGKEDYDHGRYDDALQEFRKALLTRPDHPEAQRYVRLLTGGTPSSAAHEQEPPEGWTSRVGEWAQEILGASGRSSPGSRTSRAVSDEHLDGIRPAEYEDQAGQRSRREAPAVDASAQRRQVSAARNPAFAFQGGGDDAQDRLAAIEEAMNRLEASQANVAAPGGLAAPEAVKHAEASGRRLWQPSDRAQAVMEPQAEAGPRADARMLPMALPPVQRAADGVQVFIDGQPVLFERPIPVERGRPMFPVKEIAAALGYSIINLGQGKLQLVTPHGETKDVQLSSDDPMLLVTEDELRQHFALQTRYEPSERALYAQTPMPGQFSTYTIEKSAEQLQAEAVEQHRIAQVLEAAAEEPSTIPTAARPLIETRGSITYSYENRHAAPPFRSVTSSVKGRVDQFDFAFETVRKDEHGVFQHDYTFLNLKKPDLFIGAFDQRVDLSPLRLQFASFNGVQVRKAWGDAQAARSAAPRYRPLESFPEGRAATTLAWGQTEETTSGSRGSATYLGQLFEARQALRLADRLGLTGALLYLENDADIDTFSGTSRFPRNNFVSFGNLAIDLGEGLLLSGQAARAAYQPDENPDGSTVVDWNWRAALDLDRDRYRLRWDYEFVGPDYASIGNPITYQDFKGTNLYGSYRLTDRWLVVSSFRRFRNNVDDDPASTTNDTQSFSLSTSFQPARAQSVGLRVGQTTSNPDGPSAGSSSRSISYGADYSHPFLFGTRLLSSYDYFQTEAPASSDSISHAAGTSLFKSFGHGSSWNLGQRVRKTFRELEEDNLNLDTSFTVNHQLTPAMNLFGNSTYTRDLTDGAEHADLLSASAGLRYETVSDLTLGLDYDIGPYNLDQERGRWPRNWSLLFLITKRFGFATPPTFGVIDGMAFQDFNRNGSPDAGEPRVEEVGVQLVDRRRTVLTDEQGRFAFTRVAPGTHELQVDLSNLDPVWTTPQMHRTVKVGKRKTVHIPIPIIQGGAIRGLLFIDANGDGIFQDTEEPLENVVISLRPAEDFRKTDGDGIFLFEYLVPGGYTVEVNPESLPTGYELASPGAAEVAVDAGGEAAVAFAVRLAGPVQKF